MKPFVSILVPVYKVPERYLRQCIESLINQSLKNIEIIIVDDGSPDNCGYICDEYAKHDPRIKVIHKKNGGLSSARNYALQNSIGEFITYVDGDDYLSKETCEYTYRIAKENSVDMVMWCMIQEFKNGSQKVHPMVIENIKIYSKDECLKLKEKVLDFRYNISSATSKLIRRKFLEDNEITHDINLPQGAEGFVFNIKLFEYLNSACFINKYFYHYTFNIDSITHTPNIRNYYIVIECFEFVKTQINNNNEMLKLLYERVLYAIITTAISGYFSPYNSDSYFRKKNDFKEYLKINLVIQSLEKASLKNLDVRRKLIIKLIKHQMFLPLFFLAKLRRKRLESK